MRIIETRTSAQMRKEDPHIIEEIRLVLEVDRFKTHESSCLDVLEMIIHEQEAVNRYEVFLGDEREELALRLSHTDLTTHIRLVEVVIHTPTPVDTSVNIVRVRHTGYENTGFELAHKTDQILIDSRILLVELSIRCDEFIDLMRIALFLFEHDEQVDERTRPGEHLSHV